MALPATVTALAIAPVKGLRLAAADELDIAPGGAAGARSFLVVDEENGLLLTTREEISGFSCGIPATDIKSCSAPAAASDMPASTGAGGNRSGGGTRTSPLPVTTVVGL